MNERRIPTFPSGLLEHAAKIIGEHRTGAEISELLSNAGYPEFSLLTETKWRHVYDVFQQLNARTQGGLHIAKIIQLFCEPTNWIGKRDTFRLVADELNEGLAHVRLQVSEAGKVVVTDRRIGHAIQQPPVDVPRQHKAMTVWPIFGAQEVAHEDLCFVLMPFQPAFDRVFAETIRPTVEARGLKCARADDLFSPTPILEDIWTCICRSKVVIADVTGRNPNVFYEVGIAHTVGKPVITITQNREDVPFDPARVRYFTYSDNNAGWALLRESIDGALKAVLMSN